MGYGSKQNPINYGKVGQAKLRLNKFFHDF